MRVVGDTDHEDGADDELSLPTPENVTGSQVVYMLGSDRDGEAETLEVVVPEVAAEILPWLASHDDVNGLDLSALDDPELAADLERTAAGTLKRVRRPEPIDLGADPGLRPMTAFLETKTVWHPKGR